MSGKECMIVLAAVLVTAALVVGGGVVVSNQKKKVAKHETTQVALEVLNCVYERTQEPGTYEHIVYFTLQEEADYFRVYIGDEVVMQGGIDALDLRYAPPYRRVVLVTQEPPKLPMSVAVHAFNGATLIGKGTLEMTKMCYHQKG